MSSRGRFYGLLAVLVAALIVLSTVSLYYYGLDLQVTSQNQKYQAELTTALASYGALSNDFNSSLANYKITLELLTDAVANLNTSSPAYFTGSQALTSLWASYQQLASSGGRRVLVYDAHMFVDFGNGTRKWYNDSAVQPGWNGYVTTLVLLDGNVKAAWYPQYGEHLVTGIEGVNSGSSNSWFFWEHSPGGWSVAQTGADGLEINNGTVIAWTLCGYDAMFNPTCTP